MVRLHACLALVILSLGLCGLSGCTTSTTPPAGGAGTSVATKGSDGDTITAVEAPIDAKALTGDDYPDVPRLEIMTEVDGIKIPRQKMKSDTLQLGGPIPADVGNEHAKRKPSQPTTGDTLTIRFNSEPKVLNPITESSAVQTYIMQYVNEALARQNPESFAFEPGIAKQWIVEDSVKLSPDFPGQERRLALGDGQPETSIDLDYEVVPAKDGKPVEPPQFTLTTSDKDGKPLGKVWVGVYPVGKIVGASATGAHFWSDEQGQLKIGGFPNGKYTVKVGAELFGKAEQREDGSLVLTAATEQNPLKQQNNGEPLTLQAGEWTDVQAQTYTTFSLRDDVKWSDGMPFTTKDIEFAYALLNSPSVDGDSIRTYYSDLVECTPLGAHAVRLRYRQQYFKAPEFSYGIAVYTPPFHFFEAALKTYVDENGKADPRQLTLERLTPEQEDAQKKLSAHGQRFGKFFNTDDRYNRSPLGTGPYIVDRWERGDRVELVRNQNYWEPSKAGHVDRIIVKFIPDQVSAMSALKAGEIDFFYDMSPEQFFEDWPTLDQKIRDDYVLGSWYSPMFQYFGWNHRIPQFQDRRVRIALSLLMNRQEFLETKLHGAGALVSGTQYFFGIGYDREVAPLAYDPETAKELLTEAGWIDSDNDGILDKDGVKFQIKLQLPQGKAINVQLSEIFQKNLKEVGIDLQIQQLEWASFIDKVRAKECDVILLRWAMPSESDPFQIWHSSGAKPGNRGSNSISFANAQADELIDLLRVTLDEKKRRRIHQAFHRVLDSEQPYMFLWVPKEFGVYHKRFRNVKWYRLRPGFDLSEWYVPKDEQLHK
ncbi:MAG: ABC transporter substrate-binding protein [Planctomycetota bacterium]